MEREIKKNIHVGVALMDNLFDTLTFSTHTSYDFFLLKCKYNSIKPRSYYPCFRRTIKWIEFIITYIKNILLTFFQLHGIQTLKQNRKCIVYITWMVLINMSFFINSFFFKLPCIPVFILPIVSFFLYITRCKCIDWVGKWTIYCIANFSTIKL